MTKQYEFESDRLGFRLWKDEDYEPFAKMNANPVVMKYFPRTLTKEQSDQFIGRIMNHFKEHGYGLWAVEIKDTGEFIGYLGFYTATFEAEFTPCVEIGWRLDNKFWNKGYATEGAKRCLDYGFKSLGFQEVFSFTSLLNKPSVNVMKKIGLKEHRTFLHPALCEGHPLREHVLYKIDKETYLRKEPATGYGSQEEKTLPKNFEALIEAGDFYPCQKGIVIYD
jgi:ribosomal-protein-alanine N-acetyltransferase